MQRPRPPLSTCDSEPLTEIDTNVVERAIRPIALSRKNALFAGSDEGGVNWAIIASLIETAKLNGVNPHAWLADTLTKLVNRWPASRIERAQTACDGKRVRRGAQPTPR